MTDKDDKEFNPLTRTKANDHYVKRAEQIFRELSERWGFNKKPENTKEENKDGESKS